MEQRISLRSSLNTAPLWDESMNDFSVGSLNFDMEEPAVIREVPLIDEEVNEDFLMGTDESERGPAPELPEHSLRLDDDDMIDGIIQEASAMAPTMLRGGNGSRPPTIPPVRSASYHLPPYEYHPLPPLSQQPPPLLSQFRVNSPDAEQIFLTGNSSHRITPEQAPSNITTLEQVRLPSSNELEMQYRQTMRKLARSMRMSDHTRSIVKRSHSSDDAMNFFDSPRCEELERTRREMLKVLNYE